MNTEYSVELYDPIIRMAIARIVRYIPSYLDYEDALQICRFAVWRSLERYDSTKVSLESYVGYIAKHRLLDFFRSVDGRYGAKSAKQSNISLLSLDSLYSSTVAAMVETVNLYDVVADMQIDDPEELVINQQYAKFMVLLLGKIPRRNKLVLQLRVDGKTFKAIGKCIGLSETRCIQLFNTIQRQAKKELAHAR